MYHVKNITFDEILPVWRDSLWPGRKSKIETHSVMTWPFWSVPPESSYDMSIFNYPAHFWGIFDNQNPNKLIAVNSGHLTRRTDFRSRGLWVDPNFRRRGLAYLLLNTTIECAVNSGSNMIWTLPRLTSLSAYEKAGFISIGGPINDGVEFGPNVYCVKSLPTPDYFLF